MTATKPSHPTKPQFRAQIEADMLTERALAYKEALVLMVIVLLFLLRLVWTS